MDSGCSETSITKYKLCPGEAPSFCIRLIYEVVSFLMLLIFYPYKQLFKSVGSSEHSQLVSIVTLSSQGKYHAFGDSCILVLNL